MKELITPAQKFSCGHELPEIMCISELMSGKPSRFEYLKASPELVGLGVVPQIECAAMCPECLAK